MDEQLPEPESQTSTNIPTNPETPVPIIDFEQEPPFTLVPYRELVAVCCLVVLCDLTIFRTAGFAGYALLLALAPWCLLFGSPSRKRHPLTWGFIALLLAFSGRMIWLGSSLALGCGVVALVAFAMSLSGRKPHVLGLLAYTGLSIPAGARGISLYGESVRRRLQPFKTSALLSITLPLLALVVFGSLFVLANPDLLSTISGRWKEWMSGIQSWLLHFDVLEIPFWIATAWITVGLLRPLPEQSLDRHRKPGGPQPLVSVPAPLFGPFRNTLVTVIVLFAAYLVFEFQTLWLREFPKGFHYSGYAHEGAAWLTIALALSSVLLSLIFRGDILQDARLPRLKRLGWVWSLLNLLLALAVYHRLCIYVGFNGMTRMRMVGFFGTTTVVIGLLLVVWKIARERDFAWLVRADLWALVAMVLTYALTPVDYLVMSYNVQRILAGDSAPSVQISVHPIDAEGLLTLGPLLECQDPIVREGVRALLARSWKELPEQAHWGWDDLNGWQDLSAVQLSQRVLAKELSESRSQWNSMLDDRLRDRAWNDFRNYAYQWY